MLQLQKKSSLTLGTEKPSLTYSAPFGPFFLYSGLPLIYSLALAPLVKKKKSRACSSVSNAARSSPSHMKLLLSFSMVQSLMLFFISLSLSLCRSPLNPHPRQINIFSEGPSGLSQTSVSMAGPSTPLITSCLRFVHPFRRPLWPISCRVPGLHEAVSHIKVA